MLSTPITVFEHQTLETGEQGLSDDDWEALCRFNDRHGNKYFTTGFKRVTFTSYVGTLQVGDKVIEILPKADHLSPQSEEIKKKWQRALLWMLHKAGYVTLNATENAVQQLQQLHLLDIFLYAYLQEINFLLHNGLVRKYRRARGEQYALRGRLMIDKQVRFNLVHRERFYTEHTVYDRDHRLNQVLKTALEIVRDVSLRTDIRLWADEYLLSFEPVSAWRGRASELQRLSFNRKTIRYAGAIELAKMIILHYHPDMTAGKSSVIALLFDMNRLFEQLVYQLLSSSAAKFESSDVTVSPQDEQYFWKDKTLRPDLKIEFSKSDSAGNRTRHRVMGDSKWKMIAAGDPDPHDLRQMFAYNIRYGATRSVLIYPATGQVSTSLANFEKFEGDSSADHGCETYFMGLFTAEGEPDEDAGAKFIKHLIDTTVSERIRKDQH